ncbi:MAG: hypothetical protein IKM04_05105 [Clostridia bacterium]|nr:hypothetical protein [Clostridia bacterium]
MLLNGKWTVSGKDCKGNHFTIPATVPGCIHTDLQTAGIIGDFYWR